MRAVFIGLKKRDLSLSGARHLTLRVSRIHLCVACVRVARGVTQNQTTVTTKAVRSITCPLRRHNHNAEKSTHELLY